MSKTPPNRRGITFEVGAALEARDSLKNWYVANIEKIDYEDEKVLVHYRQWSHRYDEWFDWASPYLRAMERVQLRKEGRQEDHFIPGFHVNDKVLASWSDCRFYPARVLAVNKDGSYTVKFYDGVIQTVKGIHVKPFTRESRKKLPDKTGEKSIVKKTEMDKKMENEASSDIQAAGHTDCAREEEEGDDISDLDEEECGQMRSNGKCLKGENEEGETILEQIGQHNYSKLFLKRDSGPEVKEEQVVVKTEDSGMNFKEEMAKRNETKETEQKEKEIKEHCLPRDRRSRRQRIRRKRRLSVARRSSKKSKTESEKSCDDNDCKPSCASTNQKTGKGLLGQDSLNLTQPANGSAVPKIQGQSETLRPAAVRRQAFHNPNRFSREPLYRVIKNQPPPVLSINLDHNPYKCSSTGCAKSFRKAKLLHYHMKYYHGDDRLIEQDQTKPVEKQSSLFNQGAFKKRSVTSHECAQVTAKKRSLAPPPVSVQNNHQWPSPKDKTGGNQLDSNMHGYFNKDRGRFSEMEGVKEHDRLKEKPTRDFLRIKFKEKKKIRKTISDEESLSDWSSDSCGLSEDEMEPDLDVITSPLSCSSIASTTGSRETVRCVCEAEEENDFMLQCEECLYWQHGTCMGLLEDNIPERYACFICRDSPGQTRGQRKSLRHWCDRDWFSTGHMYGLSFLENYSLQNGKKIAATHQLLGDVQHVLEVLNGLHLKISILQSQTHPDLKLWRQPWKLTGRSRMKCIALPETKTVSSPASPEAVLCKEAFSSAFQDYISSEHCYQKPQTLYQVLEPRLGLKSMWDERLPHTQRVLTIEQEYNREIQPALLKTSNAQLFDHKDVGEKREVGSEGGGVRGGSPQQQWRINLLEHIENIQEEVTHRMDFIERELDVLENWLDCTGELEPPEPLDRLPELKHSIKHLLNELGKVQQIALICAT